MSFFKALFSFSNTSIFHKSVIVTSFLVTVVLMIVNGFFSELAELLGPNSEGFFSIFTKPTNTAMLFSLLVFIISYIMSILMNLGGDSD